MMNKFEIQNNFHNLIDSIDNERVLLFFYNLMKKRAFDENGKLWQNLSEVEKDELLLAFDERKEFDNLIDFHKVKSKHNKWL